MSVTLEIEQMTTSEKISAMELLWDDMCHRAEGVESPGWHKEVLATREQRLSEGKEKISNWQDAKAKILEDTK